MTFPEFLEPVFVGDPLPQALNEGRDAINMLVEEIQGRIPFPTGAQVGDFLRWEGTHWGTTETRFFEGNGRPDGNFAAPVGSRYIDKVAAQGAVEWVKRFGGDSATGWMCLAGDTGFRDISSMVNKPEGSVVHTARVRRINQMVDFYFDLTMPAANGTWSVLAALPGFAPGAERYGGIQDNREFTTDGKPSGGTMIEADGGVNIYKTISGKRDRYSGVFLTGDAWPTTLPGSPG